MGMVSHGARVSFGMTVLAAFAVAAAPGTGAAGATGPGAKAARSFTLSDSANLRLNNHRGVELKESGYARGNLPGSIYIQLRVNSSHSVTARIQVYPSGGSIGAAASAAYHVNSSSTATFSGRLTITGGSGRYAKARGSGLSFTGTVHRPGDAVTVHVGGTMSY